MGKTKRDFSKREFTQEEIDFILNNYEEMSNPKLAEENGYKVFYVWEWDFNNNLNEVKEQILAVCRGNSTDD